MSSNEKPIPPGDFECCESGCSQCVWDTYFEEMDEWKAKQASGHSKESAGSGEKGESDQQGKC